MNTVLIFAIGRKFPASLEFVTNLDGLAIVELRCPTVGKIRIDNEIIDDRFTTSVTSTQRSLQKSETQK